MHLPKLLLVLFMCATGPAFAGPYEDASAADRKGDYETALRLYRPLAEQGDARAQYDLGVMYERGRGVARDNAVAVAWHRRAADQGNAEAQYNLGHRYGAGYDVPQYDVQAYKWLNLAASQRAAFMHEDRMRIIQSRDILALKMTPAQIAEAQKLAREWKPKLEQ